MKRLLAVLLFCATYAPVFGADVDPNYKTEFVNDFSHGLLTAPVPSKADQKGATFIRNLLFDEIPGALVAPGGYILAGSTSTLSKVIGLWSYNRDDGIQELLASDGSNVVSTRDLNTYRLVKSGLSSTVNLSCKQIRNKMWCTNGLDPVFTYDASTTVVLDGSNYGGTLGLVPNVPKGKYIEGYQERIFMDNDPTDNSGLSFSALASTAGGAIAPDDPLAWPGANKLSIGQGDGTAGTGLWVQNGTLFNSKENSIYAIAGKDEFTYSPNKIESNIGVVSNDSIVQQDGLVYFLNRYGGYKRTPQVSQRITDAITPDFDAIRKDTNRVIVNSWSSNDFGRGAYSTSTIAISSGLVILYIPPAPPGYGTTTERETGGSVNSGATQVHIDAQSPPAAPAVRFTPSTVLQMQATLAGKLTQVGWNLQSEAGSGVTFTAEATSLTIQVYDSGLSLLATYSATPSNPTGGSGYVTLNQTMDLTSQNITFNANDYVKLTLSYQWVITLGGPTTTDLTAPFLQGTGVTSVSGFSNLTQSANLRVFYNNGSPITTDYADTNGYFSSIVVQDAQTRATAISSGGFVSDVATLTVVNAWGSFNATRNTNGGSVNFFVKGATSIVTIPVATWLPITPGAVVNMSTANNYIAWASTLIAKDTFSYTTPEIELVSIEHLEGQGSTSRAVGISWKNRYWLAVSTETTSIATLIYVKSKITNDPPDAWTVLEGIPIRSMAIFNNNLYGGDSSSGKIYRLDYGTNYNGTAIDSIYETTDLVLGSNFTDKTLKEILIDAEKESGSSMLVGISIERGAYYDKTISLNGSGRLLTSINDVKAGGRSYGKWYRFRIRHNTLDTGFQFNGMGLYYTIGVSR